MREKFANKSMAREAKQAQHRDFLSQVDKLHEQERRKQEFSKRVLLDDFNSNNAKMIADRRDLSAQGQKARRAERYNYFPFIGQEMVEMNRANLSNQLKQDLQSFMNY